MRPRRSGGGLAAIRYSLAKAGEAGGMVPLTRRLASHNACKTCALGMGGQNGGMVNESRHFPEVCKKSIQAQAGDIVDMITAGTFSADQLQGEIGAHLLGGIPGRSRLRPMIV